MRYLNRDRERILVEHYIECLDDFDVPESMFRLDIRVGELECTTHALGRVIVQELNAFPNSFGIYYHIDRERFRDSVAAASRLLGLRWKRFYGHPGQFPDDSCLHESRDQMLSLLRLTLALLETP